MFSGKSSVQLGPVPGTAVYSPMGLGWLRLPGAESAGCSPPPAVCLPLGSPALLSPLKASPSSPHPLPYFLRGPSSRFAHVTPDTFPSSRGPQLLLQTGAHCLLPLELSHLGEVPTCANLHRGIVHIAFDLHSPLPGLGFLPGLALPPTSEHRAWLPAEAVRLGGTGLVQPRCQAREHSFAVR